LMPDAFVPHRDLANFGGYAKYV
ncbi:MAG: hypothetical protein QOE54_3477, partial [Streptosporangiaceae bacterium]|nr:hypothetical protein [Streptosporangiaceae bacterium]